MSQPIIEFELAEDTKELLNLNSDAKCETPALREKIFDMDDSALLKIEKTIDSPTIIKTAEEVTEELIETL